MARAIDGSMKTTTRKEEREATAGPVKFLVGDRVAFASGETATIVATEPTVKLSTGQQLGYLDIAGLELTGEIRIEEVD
jgi:hypothetical protein